MRNVLKRRPERDPDVTAVCQVAGRWHVGDVFDDTIKPFEERGHPVITPNLPIDKRRKNYDDYAQVACDAIIDSGYQKVDIVGWSLAGNVLPRMEYILRRRANARGVGQISLRKLVYVAAVLEPETATWLSQEEIKAEPEKNSLYVKAIMEYYKNQNPFKLDPITARETIYKDCPTETARRFVAKMRPQWLYEKQQPPILAFPTTESWYLYCNLDSVVDFRDYQPYIRSTVLRIPDSRTDTFQTGHAPMAVDPTGYANKISDIIES